MCNGQGSYTFLLSKIKDFPGQKLVFKHLFLSIFIYKTLFNLTFFSSENACTQSGKWWMSNVSGRKCQNFCCSIVLYEYLGYFRVGENFFFLSDIRSDRNWGSVCPMAFVSVPPFFCNIVYNLSHFVFYTELNARLPIIMNIKQLN